MKYIQPSNLEFPVKAADAETGRRIFVELSKFESEREKYSRNEIDPLEYLYKAKYLLEITAKIHEEIQRPQVTPKALKIRIAPGFVACRFLGHFCSRKFREQVLEAQLADAIADYTECLAKGDIFRARMLNIQIPFWLTWSLLGGAIGTISSVLVKKLLPK